MDKDTRVTMSEEKYNFLKNCAKNLREIDAILNSKESDILLIPTGWRMLVLPFKMTEITKGGLYLFLETL